MDKKEKFNSRLGFILISAGSAIGLGNIWRFPYVVGKNGGALFVIIYLFFLVLLGLPIMNVEFAVGRASQVSPIISFEEISGVKKWNFIGWIGFIGTYILMFFYTVITGWMFIYIFKFINGSIWNHSSAEHVFDQVLSSPKLLLFWTLFSIILGFYIIYKGFNEGVEKTTSFMMIFLFLIIILLVINSLSLPGAKEGLKFYLLPNLESIKSIGLGTVIYEAMNQAFFTLSLGIGALAIFGSRIDKKHSIFKESINVAILDTAIAFLSGLIIFPATVSYSIDAKAGPGLIFVVFPQVFKSMKAGRLWGGIFFVFMTFAALSTILAVFEVIVSNFKDKFNITRKKSIIINAFIITIGSIPVVLGFNTWSHISILGIGDNILDFYDFIVSSNLLPLGSLFYVLFATRNSGWGFDKFIDEVNTGKGIKFPINSQFYYSYVIPIIIGFIFISGYYFRFF